MTPHLYELEIELHEAVFFASHELHNLYFSEPILGNYALVYALGLAKSPYDRYHVGYGEDLPALNEKGIYITPAWAKERPRYRIEQFNCQAESFTSAMGQNVVVEIAGRQQLGKKGNFYCDLKSKKEFRPTNRPQIGILKLLCPYNRFGCHLISKDEMKIPHYVRIGKFMSKAKIRVCRKIKLFGQKKIRAEYNLINPIDLPPDFKVHFGDTVNIHPVPLIRKADIEGTWWIDNQNNPILPADLEFRGF